MSLEKGMSCQSHATVAVVISGHEDKCEADLHGACFWPLAVCTHSCLHLVGYGRLSFGDPVAKHRLQVCDIQTAGHFQLLHLQ